MTAAEFIQKLQSFPSNMQVSISDGYGYHFYHTNGIEFKEFKNDDGQIYIDIGIGGCDIKNSCEDI